MQKTANPGTDHLYLQIADRLEKMIHDETLRIGDKLPSVRLLSKEYGISMGTAFQAYYLLEAKGLIEARPKSGYYVRFNQKRFPALPAATVAVEEEPQEVSVADMIAQVFKNIKASDIVNFSIAAPPVELLPAARLSKSVTEAMRSTGNACILYENILGNRELRTQVARLAFNWAGKITADEVVITAGCMEALVMCLKAVTKSGDIVAIENPTYFGIFQVIESLGLKVVEIPADPLTGPDIDYLEQVFKKMPVKACVFVPNFNNPLGSCMPDEKKKALVQLITAHRIPLIEDDIYGELYFGKQRPKTCKTFDKEGWVLLCASVSKSVAPGYRIGWTIPGRFAAEVTRVKLMHTVTGNTLTQAAMAHFLAMGRYEYHMNKLRKVLHTQCLRYVQGIIDHFPVNTRVSRPQGGFVLWVQLDKKIDSYRLYQQAMKHNISIAPGQIFSAQGIYSNCLRISYSNPWNDRIEEGIRTLGNLVKKMLASPASKQ
ncbi:MAG: PLP-dependent aminotransferase family protein [Chitinophagaceae bacterium]